MAAGTVSGLVGVGSTVLLMTVFELVRGTSTGGGGWGLLGLVVVVALTMGVGAFALGSLRVSQPRLTAFVGEVLVLVVVLAFLLDVVYSAWMWLAIPALTAASYLGTHWLLDRTDG